ncbi:Zinc finger FYVE domain-containing protein 9 [Bagarius yarrelli]|uniref:Zinc finger FYVE domain-containing protein n=1 Tax=Bagarius yarrelli TaxID=175774 RepID=A0A556V3K0_BAGYA|nr:Zinc finger FYVE domain-containing protein 9 [Bagarius yarrelli]
MTKKMTDEDDGRMRDGVFSDFSGSSSQQPVAKKLQPSVTEALFLLMGLVLSELSQPEAKPLDFVCVSEARKVMNKVKDLQEDLLQCSAAKILPAPVRIPCIRVNIVTWQSKSIGPAAPYIPDSSVQSVSNLSLVLQQFDRLISRKLEWLVNEMAKDCSLCTRQSGASSPMENYFQAEAFNLDKVLDEFEQNEDETDTPKLTDAKWTQILAPPAHLLSLNPALTHTDLSPRDGPLNIKPLLEAQSSESSSVVEVSATDVKQELETWSEERPADIHSPPLLQPNIGKLVSTDGQTLGSPPAARVAIENGCPARLECNGVSKLPQPRDNLNPPSTDSASILDPCAGQQRQEQNDVSEQDKACFNVTSFLNTEEVVQTELNLNNGALSEEMESEAINEINGTDGHFALPKVTNSEKRDDFLQEPGCSPQNLVFNQECHSLGTIPNGTVLNTISLGQDESVPKAIEIKNKDSVMESSPNKRSYPSSLVEEKKVDHPIHLPPAPLKEDSITEEKEMEESKQECSDTNRGAEPSGKLNNGRLQQVSAPYGGARPKQPVNLKLQIPRAFSGQVQNELGSTGRNKNLEAQCRTGSLESFCGGKEPRADRLNGESGDGSSSLHIPSENPDNDLQAGQQGVLIRKPFSSLGEVAPVWVPDSQAPICMKCEVKFTFTKRRHHCRACGKVFCAACCSLKCRLMYMDRKEARVCVTCHHTLTNAQTWESGGNSSTPNPNNPAEYCSTIPPLQQAQASGTLSSPPPTVMVPVGVLKQPGTEGSLSREQRRVWFADGILPNGETTDSSKGPASNSNPIQPPSVSQISNKSTTSTHEATRAPGAAVGSSVSLIPEDGLPPILISTGVKGGTGGHIADYAVEEKPSEVLLLQQLEEGGPEPLVFVLNANLLAMVKLVNYVNRKCWYVMSKGMHAVGQAEVVVLLQCLPDEKSIPKDIFSHFVQLYQEALAGNVLSHLSHSFFTQSFLGSKEHGGFLYITPTFQSLQDLLLPNPPFLFGILVQKWETPWAKVFPIRLMLRLGAEYRFYPCPLFSVRFRKPLFGETGHTIINLLADFRNYQYTLPVVRGLVVDMEVKKTCIKIPSNRYNELMKAMNKSNEHVLAMGACFNERADSHLVCVQNDDGNYQTQAISIHHQPRKVTGASFFVFSGALKASSGFLAKTSIVEDGVMVQITAEMMEALRQALREMKDFTIVCGKADQEETQENVHIQWTEDDLHFNKGVISPIDGKSMESIMSVKIFHGSEYKANGKVIRWTEVFFLQSEDQPNGDPADHSRLTENVARAFCVALCPHLKLLKEDGMAKLGLRVTLESDQVGYLAGSNGQPLPPQYLSDLDSALIPVIHSGACQLSEGSVVMELIFYILEIIS